MPYRMHPAQFKNILSLTSRDRYLHFVSRVADWEQLWILRDIDGQAFTRDAPGGKTYLPVWPHPMYAKAFAEGGSQLLAESEVALDRFLHDCLPRLIDEEKNVGVFPDPDGTMWLVEPADLIEDLEEEIQQYE